MQLSNVKAVIFSDAELTQFLNTLNRNQLDELEGQIYGDLYWQKRRPQWKANDNRKLLARVSKLQRRIKKRLNTGNYLP